MTFLRSIFCLALISFVAACGRATPVASTPAPVWKLKDVNGKLVSSEDFKGKVVVIDFWATWCPPCREEIPGFVELQEKYRDKGLVIVGISVDQAGAKVVKPFMEKFKINYPIVLADDDTQTAFGGMDAIPTTFLIDRAGKIRERKVGIEETPEFMKRVVALVESQP